MAQRALDSFIAFFFFEWEWSAIFKRKKLNWKDIENKISVFAADVKNGIIKYKMK